MCAAAGQRSTQQGHIVDDVSAGSTAEIQAVLALLATQAWGVTKSLDDDDLEHCRLSTTLLAEFALTTTSIAGGQWNSLEIGGYWSPTSYCNAVQLPPCMPPASYNP
jgi:hypothetical protein